MIQVNTEEVPPYDELFIDVVNCGTVGDSHPKEIVVDDVHPPWCNEAYTTVQLPASASSKGTASLHIKVNTGAGGNMLSLHVFQGLPKPDQPRWSAQWTGSCQHQANCIQQIPYTPIWHTPWPNQLVALVLNFTR